MSETRDVFDLREGESVEDFAERMKRHHQAPTAAEMRARQDHADRAYEFLSAAPFHGDAEMAKVMVDAATVHATLALHDKVEELCQTIKHAAEQSINTNAELSGTIKKATNHVVTELRRATVRPAA